MKKLIKFKEGSLKVEQFKNFIAFRAWVDKKIGYEFYKFLFPKDMKEFSYLEDKNLDAYVNNFVVDPYVFDKAKFLEETGEDESVKEALSRYPDNEILIMAKCHIDEHDRTILEVDNEKTYLPMLEAALSYYSDAFYYLINKKLYVFAC